MKYPVKRKLRRSQAVTTFGPGSLVDLREESIMMAGIDRWPLDHAIEIHEPNLEDALDVNCFRMPSTVDLSYDGKDLPIVLFPRWMVCPKCHRLAPYDIFAGGLVKPDSAIKCPACKKKVYPARLIVACRHGHIDDFPWKEWVKKGEHPCACEKPSLFLTSSGRTATLADLTVKCNNAGCGGYRSLAGATEKASLKFMQCSGNRPWLQDKEECGEDVTPLQRGASNVYFSLVSSSISIPPWSKSIQKLLNPHWAVLKFVPDETLSKVIEGMELAKLLRIPIPDIVKAIIERKNGEMHRDKNISERELRFRECIALQRPLKITDAMDDFKTREVDVDPKLKGFVTKVILVDRLREVRALKAFTRIFPPDPDQTTRDDSSLSPISRTRLNWLPAIEVRGEGIYLELDEDAVDAWAHLSTVKKRVNIIKDSYIRMCERKDWQPLKPITPQFLLIHSLAHALIRQLSLESGYSSASIRERLYTFEKDEMGNETGISGLMVYTSTPDSEGSLGGLVRQGYPQRLGATLRTAIHNAAWCSSDPLCIESEGQGQDGTNLAACHACLLLSETCCEQFNRFLDRAMLIGTLDNPKIGFFHSLLER